MTTVPIRAVPTNYRGVEMRSMLEARWASNLDRLGIEWEYEPRVVLLPSGRRYLPDFWLPRITTWLEVKGEHGERVDKAREFFKSIKGADWTGGRRYEVMGVIGGPQGRYGAISHAMFRCEACGCWQFINCTYEDIYNPAGRTYPWTNATCRSCGVFALVLTIRGRRVGHYWKDPVDDVGNSFPLFPGWIDADFGEPDPDEVDDAEVRYDDGGESILPSWIKA